MHRRDFLRLAGLSTSGLVLPAAVSRAFAQSPADRWRTFEVTTRVEVLNARRQDPRVAADAAHRRHALPEVAGQHVQRRRRRRATPSPIPVWGLGLVWAEWAAGTKPVLTLVSRFATRDVAVDLAKPGKVAGRPRGARALPQGDRAPADRRHREDDRDGHHEGREGRPREGARDLRLDLRQHLPRPQDARLRHRRHQVHAGDRGTSAASAPTSTRSTSASRGRRGCRRATSTASAWPSREHGYKSLGAGTENITKAQHCRAEVFLTGFGWVPVDPADVRKVVLEEPPGNLPLGDEKVTKARARLFGSWEMNWLAYNFAHDVALPGRGEGRRSRSSCIRSARPRRAASTASTRTTSSTRSPRARSDAGGAASRGPDSMLANARSIVALVAARRRHAGRRRRAPACPRRAGPRPRSS